MRSVQADLEAAEGIQGWEKLICCIGGPGAATASELRALQETLYRLVRSGCRDFRFSREGLGAQAAQYLLHLQKGNAGIGIREEASFPSGALVICMDARYGLRREADGLRLDLSDPVEEDWKNLWGKARQ